MKSAISVCAAVLFAFFSTGSDPLRERVLRDAAIEHGLVAPEDLAPAANAELAALGGALFESPLLSFNGDTSCSSCHLDRFGSADGIPVAIGVGGEGEGAARVLSGGAIVPRNALPLWGRGAPGFDRFFWDGKVELLPEGNVLSQFGWSPPSNDPLVVAAHLPVVQIREMVVDDIEVQTAYETETVESAQQVFAAVTRRVADDPELGAQAADVFSVAQNELTFLMLAEAIAAFIRDEFQVRESRFSRFVFEQEPLSELEVRGGLLFYGKGRCASCHTGPHFSDFEFHAVPIQQVSFGMNGFGVDYGRFNTTRSPTDRYLFRTPPLWQVAATGPYGHAGGASSLQEAIEAHFDPLSQLSNEDWQSRDRVEFYQRLRAWAAEDASIPHLSHDEVEALAAFLHTLSFVEATD
ncbi:MAG: hypothetical protein JKP96_13700 [Oceanicaulis sp.]|jgi:cytochrome c peroxidase|nr:hypothetical protein [Oceanicaulis sp.]